MIKNLIRWMRPSARVGAVTHVDTHATLPVDIIEPPEWWKRNLSGIDCAPSVEIPRQYVNYYREKEGLPVILKDEGVLTIHTIVWLYDMVKKYETLE